MLLKIVLVDLEIYFTNGWSKSVSSACNLYLRISVWSISSTLTRLRMLPKWDII